LSNTNSNVFSNREKYLFTALIAAVLIACLLKLGGLTNYKEIRHLYLEQNRIRSEIEQLDAMLVNEQQLTAGYLETAPDRQRFEKLIPLTNQQPAVIGELEKLFQREPGRLLTMRVNEQYDYGDYSAQNIAIKIGDLSAFPDHLLMQLENFPQLLIIEQFEWQAGDTETGTINLSLNLYYLN